MQHSEQKKAYDYAIYLLSLSLRTEGELRQKMQAKKYPPNVVEGVMAQLLENKYLDDQRYAEVYLENLKKYKNFGFYGIKKKLMEKKLSSQIIENVLAEGLTISDELQIANRFLKKDGVKVAPADEQPPEQTYSTFNLEASKQKQKTSQKLKARGFRGETISKLVF